MLQTKAMLANLNITQWSARKFDRSVSSEIDQNHNAQDGGRYNKLLIDKEHLSPIQQFSGKLRRYHNEKTLPWGDNGDRLLPAKFYMEYTNELRQYKSEFESLVNNFCSAYPQLVQDRRVKLGTLYDPADYPPIEEIRSSFTLKTTFMPIPDTADFRVDVGNDALEQLRSGILNEIEERQKGAIEECWQRLRDCLTRIETTLRKEKPRIFESMMGDAQALTGIIPKLNLTDDPELNRVCEYMSENITRITTTALKHSPSLREEVADRAQRVLSWIPQL